MTPFRFALPLFILLTATPTMAQDVDCKSDDYLEAAMAHMESHYRSFPEELFTAQLLMKEGFGQEDLKTDGAWGPRTENAICSTFVTYTKIGGSEGDWGISRASHTPQFTSWLLTSAHSNLSDGAVDLPD